MNDDVPRPNLLDLPNEVLLPIFSDSGIISDKDLFSLATLSRRLNALATPIYLSRKGIQNPDVLTTIYILDWDPSHREKAQQPDALSGLSIYLGFKQTAHLICYFQDPDQSSTRNSFQQPTHLSLAVGRLIRFVQRMTKIGKAEIFLVGDLYFTDKDRGIPSNSVSVIQAWSDSFGLLLNGLVERECSLLKVQYQSPIRPKFQMRRVGTVKKVVSYLSKNMRNSDKDDVDHFDWSFETYPNLNEEEQSQPMAVASSDMAPISLSWGSRQTAFLRSLHIHSPVLITPPFINWTMALLKHQSLINTLSFEFVPVPKPVWKIVLKSMVDHLTSSLTSLSFGQGCSQIETPDLMHFLSPLHRLTYLSFDRAFMWSLSGVSPSSLPDLKGLTVLKAREDFFELILSSSVTRPRLIYHFPLPNLKSAVIYPHKLLGDYAAFVGTTGSISSVVRRLKAALPLLVVKLDLQWETVDFGYIVSCLQARHAETEVHHSLWDTLTVDGADDGNTIRGGSRHASVVFPQISRLVLSRGLENMVDKIPETLAVWLKYLFPDLIRLVFNVQHFRGGVEGVILDFVKMLADHCPGLKELRVGNLIYRL